MKHAVWAASALLLATATAHAQEGAKPDPYRGDEETPAIKYPPPMTRFGVIGAGVAITAIGWGAAFGSATAWGTVPGSDQLKIPIVGPWLALGKSGCASDDPDCGAKVYVRGVLYVLDALVQLGGLGMIAQGIFMKTQKAPPKASAGFLGVKRGGFEIRPTPVVGAQITGLGVIGSF